MRLLFLLTVLALFISGCCEGHIYDSEKVAEIKDKIDILNNRFNNVDNRLRFIEQKLDALRYN